MNSSLNDEVRVRVSKNSKILTLVFMNDKYLDDGDKFEDDVICICYHLPLPLRLDEEWFKKYKRLNSIGKEIEEILNKKISITEKEELIKKIDF